MNESPARKNADAQAGAAASAGANAAPAPLALREPATAPAPLESSVIEPAAAKSEPPDAPAVRAGVMLRQVREAAGIDAELLANALKVPLYRIEALEAGRLKELPDITFARGLAASICRHLGGDAAAVLACMPTSHHGLHSPASNTGYAPFHRDSDRPASLLLHLFSKPVLIVLALLLLGAAALSLLPTLPIQLGAPAETAPENASGNSNRASAPGMVLESIGEQPLSPQPATSPVQPAPASSAPPPAAASAATPAPAAATPEAPPASETAEPGTSAQAITFLATQPTWVNVRDAKGKNLMDRTLKTGEQASISEGELPLSVKIGNVDGVSVTVRGEPFDAKALARGSVARFEVK